MVTAPRSQSVSQSANQLAADFDQQLGIDTKGLSDTERDVARFEKQADSKIAKWSFKVLGGVFGFGRNMITPFEDTSKDLDRLAKNSHSIAAKGAYMTLGAGFSVFSKAFALPHDFAMGTVDVVIDPSNAIKSIPTAPIHNGETVVSGGELIANGRVSEGMTLVMDGVVGDVTLAYMSKSAMKAAPKVYSAYTAGVNAALKAGKIEHPVGAMDAFDIAAQNPEFGAMRKARINKTLTMILDEKLVSAILRIDPLLLELAQERLANSLHNDWRFSRGIIEGTAADGLPMREPRWKMVAADDAALSKIPEQFKRMVDGKTEVDIANLDFNRLPAKYQFENAAAAEGAVRIIEKLVSTRGGYVIDLEEASAMVHEQWLERNGSWAPAEQNRPYEKLSEIEKEKDRVIVRAAAREINKPMPPDYVTIKLVEARR